MVDKGMNSKRALRILSFTKEKYKTNNNKIENKEKI